jgi:hypothetical protein
VKRRDGGKEGEREGDEGKEERRNGGGKKRRKSGKRVSEKY